MSAPFRPQPNGWCQSDQLHQVKGWSDSFPAREYLTRAGVSCLLSHRLRRRCINMQSRHIFLLELQQMLAAWEPRKWYARFIKRLALARIAEEIDDA